MEDININARIRVGEKRRRGMTKKMTNKEMIASDAAKALRYDGKMRVTGGFDLKHKPSSCGVALKWLLGVRKITYVEFAKRYNGTTAQNINHLLNRADKSRFFEEDVEKMCKILKVSVEYFNDLCDKIEEMMESGDGAVRR